MKPVYKTLTQLTEKGYEYIEYPSGHKEWFLNGKRHREDGPALEYPDGYKAWFLNGKFHREDGPAMVHPNGYKAWYLNDKKIILETKSKNPKVKKLQDIMKIQEILDA